MQPYLRKVTKDLGASFLLCSLAWSNHLSPSEINNADSYKYLHYSERMGSEILKKEMCIIDRLHSLLEFPLLISRRFLLDKKSQIPPRSAISEFATIFYNCRSSK